MTTSPSTPTPSVPKTPFFLADGLVLLVVLLLVWTGSTPLGPIEKTGIALCLIFGGVITATPFVIDYRRRKEPAAPDAGLSALSSQLSTQPAAPAEPPAWVAEFQSLRSRLDALEQSLATTATTAHADLRRLLDENRAAEQQSLAAAQESLQRTLAAFATIETGAAARLAELRTLGEKVASSQQAAAAQSDALLAASRDATEQQEAARRALDEATSAARNAFTAEAERLLARLGEQSTAALAAWDARSAAIIQERVAAEIAEERASAARRSAAAATLVLEPSPAAAPSGKSRLGRGLESLITSPQAKPAAPVVVEPPPAAQLSLPEVESAPATPPPAPAVAKPEPAALDPFFIPANGYADLASAMDAGTASAPKRG